MMVRIPDKDDPEWIDIELLIAIRNGDFDRIAKAIRNGAPFDRFARAALADLFDQGTHDPLTDINIDDLPLALPNLSKGRGYWRAVPKGRVAGKPPKPPFTLDIKEREVFYALLKARHGGDKFEAAAAEISKTHKLSRAKIFEILARYDDESS